MQLSRLQLICLLPQTNRKEAKVVTKNPIYPRNLKLKNPLHMAHFEKGGLQLTAAIPYDSTSTIKNHPTFYHPTGEVSMVPSAVDYLRSKMKRFFIRSIPATPVLVYHGKESWNHRWAGLTCNGSRIAKILLRCHYRSLLHRMSLHLCLNLRTFLGICK